MHARELLDTPAAAPRRQSKGAAPMIALLLPILLSVLLGVVGQLILKHGMTVMGRLDIGASGLLPTLWRMATSPYVVVGLLIYVGGTFFWLLALNRLDLTFVYPFASLSYVLIFFAAWLLFHENVSPLRVAGMLVICLGVLLVARS
jgi:drug/metabolite transporter (DMT)-like permease